MLHPDAKVTQSRNWTHAETVTKLLKVNLNSPVQVFEADSVPCCCAHFELTWCSYVISRLLLGELKTLSVYVLHVCEIWGSCVCVFAMHFGVVSHRHRKSSLPVGGGNVSNCDLWLFSLTCAMFCGEKKQQQIILYISLWGPTRMRQCMCVYLSVSKIS